jgi:2-dehydro-3-deoxy-D-arabinonate dehydratase
MQWLAFARDGEGIVVKRGDKHFRVTREGFQGGNGIFNLLAQEPSFVTQCLLEASLECDAPEPRSLQEWIRPRKSPILGAGVTFSNSLRERRLETFRAGALIDVEDDGRPTPYDVVYDTANPPEVFFKATDYGHLANDWDIWIRPDGAQDGSFGSSVPEPERVLVVNRLGQIVAQTVGSDTTARQLESLSPLYLPAAKTYLGCTTLSPWLTVYEPVLEVVISMEIIRDGQRMYLDEYSSTTMKRSPESLVRHARTLAPGLNGLFEDGFALFTGTGIIPPIDFSLQAGDRVIIDSPQLGRIDATTNVVPYNF